MSKLIVIQNGLWGTPESRAGVGIMEQMHEYQHECNLTQERLSQLIAEVFEEQRPQRPQRQFRLYGGRGLEREFNEAIRLASENWSSNMLVESNTLEWLTDYSSENFTT